MANVLRFTLSTARTLDVPGAGTFHSGVLDVDANNLRLVTRTRFLAQAYGAVEVGIVDSETPYPSLPAVPGPPEPDPYPQYATVEEVVASDALRAAFVAHGDGEPLGNRLTKVGVVLEPGGFAFDSQMLEGLVPFADPESGRLAGVYTGYDIDGDDNHIGSIGLAYSDDGVHWEKAGQLIAGSGVNGAPDEAGCTGPLIVLHDGIYYLFRIGLTDPGYEAGTKTLICSSTPSLATPVWTHHGVMLAPGGTGWRAGAIWHPCIVRYGSGWLLFINATGADGKERIGLATATNLTGPWTPEATALFTAPSDVGIVGDPVVRKIPGGWRMDYFAYDGTGNDWYTTTSDAEFPHGWVDHDPDDLTRRTLDVGPAGSFDQDAAHKPTLLVLGGRLFHYYTAVGIGGRRIALACDPPLSVGATNDGDVTPQVPGSFSQIHTAAGAVDFGLASGGAYARVTGLAPARVQARAGDLLDLRLTYIADNGPGDVRADMATLDASDGVVSYASGAGPSGRGYAAWTALGSRYEVATGDLTYVVQDDDVVAGTVTVVPVFKAESGIRTIFNTTVNRVVLSVRNTGPGSPRP